MSGRNFCYLNYEIIFRRNAQTLKSSCELLLRSLHFIMDTYWNSLYYDEKKKKKRQTSRRIVVWLSLLDVINLIQAGRTGSALSRRLNSISCPIHARNIMQTNTAAKNNEKNSRRTCTRVLTKGFVSSRTCRVFSASRNENLIEPVNL